MQNRSLGYYSLSLLEAHLALLTIDAATVDLSPVAESLIRHSLKDKTWLRGSDRDFLRRDGTPFYGPHYSTGES